MKSILPLLLFIPYSLFAQEDQWAKWDENYRETDVIAMLEREQKYADSIDGDAKAVKFYRRRSGYRFEGVFTGEFRNLTEDRREAMKSTFKLFGGENPIFDKTREEVQIRLADNQILWLPIQPQLVKPFKKEIKKRKPVYLYCIFFNQHKRDGTLYNIFFISEFRKM
jgi:chorismate mutase